MTGADIITDVRSGLLEPVPGFWTDQELLTWINRAETDFVNRTRILEGKETLTTVPGQSEYPLPTNWMSSKGIFYNDQDTTTLENRWGPLEATSLEKMKQENPSFLDDSVSTRNKPRLYWIWEREVNLFPVPDVSSQIKMFFKAKPTPLTSTSSSINIDDALAPALVEYVKWKAWEKEKELDLANSSRELYFEHVGQGLRWVKKQAGDQTHRFDLESPYPFSYGSGNWR